MGTSGVRDAQAVPSNCDPALVTLAGPCLSFPAGSKENERDVGWELSLPWGRESSPSPAFPCPVPGQRAPAGGTPGRSLRGKRRKQLGGSCSFSSHPTSSPTVHRRTRCCWHVQMYAHGCLHMHVLISVCMHTKAQGCIYACRHTHTYACTYVFVFTHAYTYTCTHAAPSRQDMSAL